MEEIWKDIPNYNGYQVSNLGRVRTHNKITFTIDTNMTVNHKDGNRLNNCVNNLEWMTLADNIRYGFENNQYPQKSLVLYNSKERIDFNSQTKASLFLGRNKGYICSCVKYNRNAVSRKTNIEYKILLKQTKTIK